MRFWTLFLLGVSLYGQSFPTLRLERVAGGVVQCTDIQSPKDGSGRLFLVEQPGRIRILRNGQIEPTLFLDLRSRVVLGSETGLLGLAFPPGFAQKQYFYVNYTPPNPLRTVISRFRVSATNPDVADPASEQIILTFNQPFANHNGGGLVFGPDGYLYIGTGDGGSANDPQGNGQNMNTLLGKMLRIDTESGAATYVVPPTNPFVGSGSRPEIWALGLRNPWRYSFDRETGDLYIADVGQDRAEEVNFQPAASPGGQNYGWNTMEGLNCRIAGCSMTGLTLPVMEYTHALGISVTGGYVYRGTQFPALRGIYFFGDYGSGRIWGLRRNDAGVWQNQVILNAAINISTFGEDQNGEIFLARHSGGAGGEIYRMVDGASSPLAVNAASYANSIAREGITSAFGTTLATTTATATSTPLPTTLGGTTVRVRDSAGVERPAPLFYVSPTQVNYQIPPETASGAATVTITSTATATGNIQIAAIAPGLFAFDASGQGLAAALIQRVRADGTQSIEAVTATPINLGPATDQVFLALYGTGIRGRSAFSAVRCVIGGVEAPVSFAGAQGAFVGLDQINVLIPRSLAGRGSVDIVLTVDGIPANTVRVAIQ